MYANRNVGLANIDKINTFNQTNWLETQRLRRAVDNIQLIWVVLVGTNHSLCAFSVWFLCLSAVIDPLLHMSFPAVSPGKFGRIYAVQVFSLPCSYILGHMTSSPPVTCIDPTFGMGGRL